MQCRPTSSCTTARSKRSAAGGRRTSMICWEYRASASAKPSSMGRIFSRRLRLTSGLLLEGVGGERPNYVRRAKTRSAFFSEPLAPDCPGWGDLRASEQGPHVSTKGADPALPIHSHAGNIYARTSTKPSPKNAASSVSLHDVRHTVGIAVDRHERGHGSDGAAIAQEHNRDIASRRKRKQTIAPREA